MTDEDKMAEMLLTWEEGQEQGHPIAPEELCGACPELLVPLRERIRLLANAAWMAKPIDKPRTLADRYSLEQLIGSGGYSQVWRAYDLQLRRHVAVKMPKPNRPLTAVQIEEVLTEARQVARLKHPNIVTVHDVVRDGAGYFIVTDLIEGQTLAERLGLGRMPIAEAVKLLAEIARVIDYAHGQGVIHRDLKPANIFLDHAGRPHVGDFGIARSEHELLDGSDGRGTLAYSSPEQLEGKPLDGRSDIWSLGVILFEILAGRQPFVDDNPVRLREKLTSATTPALYDVPEPLVAVCHQCLARKREDRFARGTDLAAALEAAASAPRKSRRWFLALGIPTVVVASVGIWPSRETEQPPTNKSRQDEPPQDLPPPAMYVGTRQRAADWVVTGGGANQAPAFPHGGQQPEISITDNGGASGRFVSGGSAAQFNGFWMATRRFSVPSNAQSVRLTFSALQGDDRCVLLLNGTMIANYAVIGAGPNSMSLSPGVDAPFKFTNTTAGTVDAGFVLGGENTLSLVVNNVNGGYFGTTSSFTSSSDGTHAGVDATVTFTLAGQ